MIDKFYTAIRPLLKFLAVVLGAVFFVLGILGLVTPVLPHTPFFIATALLWGFGSRRLHQWLHELPLVGEVLVAWRKEGAIPFRAKVFSTLMLVPSILISACFGPWLWYQIVIPSFLVFALWFILTRPRPRHAPPEGVSVYVALFLYRRALRDLVMTQ